MTSPSPAPAPNHHADHPGFAGLGGLVAAASMTFGRGDVSRLAADLIELSGRDHLVDVGCGPGAAARQAARRGACVTAVDPAPIMLAVARRLTRDASSITWADGAAEALPLEAGSASVVWTLSSAHHWTDIAAGLGEARRVLGPAGRLLAIERRTPPGATGHASHGWTEAQAEGFAAECGRAGLTEVQVATHRVGRRTVISVRARRP